MQTVCKNNFAALSLHLSKPANKANPVMAKLRELMDTRQAKVVTALFMFLALLVFSQGVFAFTTPSTGSFGYNVYDIAINKIASGPIGFVGGAWLIAMGSTKMNEGWTRALPFILAGSCLIKLDEITQSLGATIF
ncbi:conjugative transfer protein TraE [Salmonella enterica]|nr:conjugative transfer protein TraE [Salmonella enterica]ECT4918005.1 conjugative transfer protein TraE [Salmonella enterica subsp. enterica serovar Newport]ECU9588135.1 conjugative transfer protein TraE [Salmonella enterica subsp. enterica serovar Gaminara]EDM1377090.1 conjugative transfer protein TraE [Salmonella enterica subsp. enterica serovar Poona]EDT6860592.1 conjugative transfer protein TraE [Salmonella enterica subsp. enterica]